jgi:hypothetical protein
MLAKHLQSACGEMDLDSWHAGSAHAAAASVEVKAVNSAIYF